MVCLETSNFIKEHELNMRIQSTLFSESLQVFPGQDSAGGDDNDPTEAGTAEPARGYHEPLEFYEAMEATAQLLRNLRWSRNSKLAGGKLESWNL